MRWGQAPLTFELASTDLALLARARVVFRPWPSAPGGEPACAWRVEPVRDPGGAPPDRWAVGFPDSRAPLFRATADAALTTVERLAVEVFWACPGGPITVHAALVARAGTGVLIAGAAGAGKSTLASALWQRGWTLLGDDVALVDVETARAWSAPRRVSLRDPSRDLLGAPVWARIGASPSSTRTPEGYLFHPQEVDRREAARSTRLEAVIFLDRATGPAGPGGLAPLASAHALLALLSHSDLFVRLGLGAAIQYGQSLCDRVHAYDLGRMPLGEMARAIETAVDRTR